MATSVKVVDNLPKFAKLNKVAMANALNEMARDTLIDAKNKAPFQKGGLRSDSNVKSTLPLVRDVFFNKEYARYQEYGGDSRRTIRNYTTSGTGKKFLTNAGDKQYLKGSMIIKKHAKMVRV